MEKFKKKVDNVPKYIECQIDNNRKAKRSKVGNQDPAWDKVNETGACLHGIAC